MVCYHTLSENNYRIKTNIIAQSLDAYTEAKYLREDASQTNREKAESMCIYLVDKLMSLKKAAAWLHKTKASWYNGVFEIAKVIKTLTLGICWLT